MNIWFRADCTYRIGTGHVMRCLALAEELASRGAKITFICREIPAFFVEQIKNKGMTVKRLPPVNDASGDAYETIRLLKTVNQKVDWLIADHYELDSEWEETVGSYVSKIAVIDDLANRKHQCDLLLDQNFYEHLESRYAGLLREDTIQLLGPKYAVLRQEFVFWRQRLSDRDGEVQRILVCFGGTDPTQETLKALKALDDSRFSGIHIDVATGAANPQIKTIQKLSESMNHVTVHIQAPNMAELMAQADLAVCSGGTLTWERYCLGLPGIVIAVAKNQIKAMESLMPRGIDRYLGVSEMVTPEDIRQAVLEFMSAPASVKKSGRLAQKMVDGKGAERIADYIFGLGT